MEVYLMESPKNLDLASAKKASGLSACEDVEVLGTYPNFDLGQSSEGVARKTSLTASPKWSSEKYYWCVGMVGIANILEETHSFLSHTATHGNASANESRLVEYHRDAVRRMLDAAGDSAVCDVAIFGGTNANKPGTHFSRHLMDCYAAMIITESRNQISPLIIPPSARDTKQTPHPKNVLVANHRLFFFEPKGTRLPHEQPHRFLRPSS